MIYKKTYYYFKSALSHKLCDDIIKCGFSENPNIALTGNRKPRNKIEHSHVMELRKSATSWITDIWLKNELKPYVDRANQNAGWNFNLTKPEPGQFTVYDEGQYYDWHVDSNYDVYKKGDDWNGLMRKLSVTVSLSDPLDYEGGNLEFAIDGDEPGKNLFKTCKEIFTKGSIVIFPSYVWHRITPVTKGRRLSLVQWNMGPGYV
jgi:PKHD-type hydroxylase